MSEETQTEDPTMSDEINLNDLAVVLQVIDVCSKRGAFEGNELKDVGTLRERIAKFVNARLPKEEATEGEGAEDAPEEEAAAAESEG